MTISLFSFSLPHWIILPLSDHLSLFSFSLPHWIILPLSDHLSLLSLSIPHWIILASIYYLPLFSFSLPHWIFPPPTQHLSLVRSLSSLFQSLIGSFFFQLTISHSSLFHSLIGSFPQHTLSLQSFINLSHIYIIRCHHLDMVVLFCSFKINKKFA